MKFKIIFVASIVFFWSISFTIAAQFEDYKWGSSVSQTKQLLRKKEKNFIEVKNTIVYDCYYSKEYFPLYRKEEEEIESKESNRF